MAITQRSGVSSAVAPGARRDHRGSLLTVVAVLLIGAVITVVLAVVTAREHDQTDHRLLALQSRLIAAAGEGEDQLYVQDHLGGAASLAAATDGDLATFRKSVGDSVAGHGPFDAASLWRVAAPAPQLIGTVGVSPLLAPTAARMVALLRRAATSKTFVVTKITSAHQVRLGFAAAASGPHGAFVVYAEEPLPPGLRAPKAASPYLSPLNLAVYLGRSATAANLVETDSPAPLPLRGATVTTRIPFGDTVLTIVTSTQASLSGAIPAALPWLVVAGGLLLTAAVAVLAERLVRRRRNAEQLAGRIRGLYLEQRSLAETLQRALLPQQLPHIPGVEIATRYLPGGSGVDVGGDWYDVVPLDDDHFVFMIGDVSGRGVEAAAVMASLHYASRAYALEGHPPGEILGQLARALDVQRDGHFATVQCGLIDVPGHTILLASAGHLPLLMAGRAGARLVKGATGPPIGVTDLKPYATTQVSVPRAGTVIAYTDGLVERRDEVLDDGLKRLEEAASQGGSSLEELLTRLVNDLTEGSPTDDIALIGLRWLN